MVLKLEDKQAIVDEIASVAANSVAAIAAEYCGLKVEEMTVLRAKARQNGVYARVVRNTLARRAVKETKFACLQEALVGPLILLFAKEDPGEAARLARDFAKDHEKLKVKALTLGDKLLPIKALETVAQLPNRDQAIALLMSVSKAPITQLVRTMAEPYAMLTRVMGAIRDQKQAG